MKLLYLYIAECSDRDIKNEHYRFDSNDVFTVTDDGKLTYEHYNALPKKFWTTPVAAPKWQSRVDSVSAIVGANGAGKTSIATILGRCFELGRPSPKYACVILEDDVYTLYENLENKIDCAKVEMELGRSHFKHFTEKDGWSPHEPPFHFVYYSPFCATQTVWEQADRIDGPQNMYDLSATKIFTMWTDANGQPLKFYDDYNRRLSFEFARVFHEIDRGGTSRMPFALPSFVRIVRNVAHSQTAYLMVWHATKHGDGIQFECSNKQLLDLSWLLSLINIQDVRIGMIVDYAGVLVDENTADNAVCNSLLSSAGWKAFVALGVWLSDIMKQEEKKMHWGAQDIRQRFEAEWRCMSTDMQDVVLDEIGRRLSDIRNDSVAEWETFARLWKAVRKFAKHEDVVLAGNSVECSLSSLEAFGEFLDLMKTHDEMVDRHGFLNFVIPGLSSGEMTSMVCWGRLYECFKKMKIAQGSYPERQWVDVSRVIDPDDIKKREDVQGVEHVLLFMDEAETTMHPEWQRKLVSSMIWFIENCTHHLAVHIVFASHSPMLLSDIPKSNIQFLFKARADYSVDMMKTDLEKLKNTFGANIFDLYRLTYFLNEGPVGEFAHNKIKNLLRSIAALGAKSVGLKVMDENGGTDDLMNLEEIKMLVKIVGDPLLQNYFQNIAKLGML